MGSVSFYDRMCAYIFNMPQLEVDLPSLKRDVKAEFDYATRYLDVEAALAQYDISDAEIHNLRDSVIKGDYKAPIFEKIEKVPYIALKAFFEKVIGKEEFTNTMFYWSIRQHHLEEEIDVVQVFDSLKRLTREGEALLETFKYIPNSKLDGYHLNSTEREDFLEKIKALPESAQTFFIFSDIQEKIERKEMSLEAVAHDKITISQGIIESLNSPIFNRIEIGGKTRRMVPSFEMMQETLKAVAGEKAVTITPTLGVSSLEEIRSNGLRGERDMGIPFPGLEFPQIADYYRCTEKYDFFFHDFYHAYVASFIPSVKREQFIHFSDLVASSLQEVNLSPSLTGFAHSFKEQIIDMEHSGYILEAKLRKRSVFDKFFKSIDLAQVSTFNKRILQLMVEQRENGEKIDSSKAFKSSEELQHELVCSQYLKVLARRVVRGFSNFAGSQAEWCKKIIEYGDSIETVPKFMGKSKNDSYQAELFIQAKAVCQNPYLLT